MAISLGIYPIFRQTQFALRCLQDLLSSGLSMSFAQPKMAESRESLRCYDWGSDLFAVRWFPSPSDSLEQLDCRHHSGNKMKQPSPWPNMTKQYQTMFQSLEHVRDFLEALLAPRGHWSATGCYLFHHIPSIPAWKACRTCLELLWDTWLLVPSTRFALSASAPIQPEPGAGLLNGHNCFPEPHLGCSLEAEIKMNQDESMSQMPNNMDLLGIRHQNLKKNWKQHRPKTGFTACAIRLAKASLTSILDIRLTASCRVPSMPWWEIPGGTNCNPPSLCTLNWGEACKLFLHVAHCPPLWWQRDAGAASGFHVQIQLASWFRSFSSKRWLDSAQLDLVEHNVFLPLFLSIYIHMPYACDNM